MDARVKPGHDTECVATPTKHRRDRLAPHFSGMIGSITYAFRPGPACSVTSPPNTAAGRPRRAACLKGPTPGTEPGVFNPAPPPPPQTWSFPLTESASRQAPGTTV